MGSHEHCVEAYGYHRVLELGVVLRVPTCQILIQVHFHRKIHAPQLAQQDNMDHPRLKMTIRSPAPTRFLRCAVNANFVPLANGQQKLVWPLTMIVIPARKDISKLSNS